MNQNQRKVIDKNSRCSTDWLGDSASVGWVVVMRTNISLWFLLNSEIDWLTDELLLAHETKKSLPVLKFLIKARRSQSDAEKRCGVWDRKFNFLIELHFSFCSPPNNNFLLPAIKISEREVALYTCLCRENEYRFHSPQEHNRDPRQAQYRVYDVAMIKLNARLQPISHMRKLFNTFKKWD